MMMSRLRNTLSLLLMMMVLFASIARAQNPATKPQAAQPQPQATNTPVTGSGTPGQLTRWSGLTPGTSVLGDSVITEDKFGKIGIGTTAPSSKLTVQGMIETTLGGYKFPDGTIQTTAGVSSIFHDATLTGNGTQGSPLGLATPLSLNTSPAPSTSLVNLTASATLGTLVVNNMVGSGIVTQGGTALGFNNNSFGSSGVFAKGGSSPGIGGPGVKAFGGLSGMGAGGTGVEATGASTFQLGDGDGGIGVLATGGMGIGAGHKGGNGLEAFAGSAGFMSPAGLAGLFHGAVEVQGNFNVAGGGTKNFKIDHPLDPENKYLYHAAIESSEVLNIYSGNTTTDENGEAVVALPDWFEAVNRDFRYQLTVVGTFAQAIVGNKIKNNRFIIKTNTPGVEVSWQVTGIRSDAAIRKHPFKLEEEKTQAERGYYLAPEAYDQPEERGIEWARNPELMKQRKAAKERADISRSKLASDN